MLLKGLAADELTFEGKYYQYRNVPMILRPVQHPHPPLWYGTTIPENADWPAANDVNIVMIALRPTVRVIMDRYRAERARLGKKPQDTPCSGSPATWWWPTPIEAALEIARRAYPRWRDSFRWLFQRHGAEPRITALYPPRSTSSWRSTTASPARRGRCGISSPPRSRRPATNYQLSWFAFGDMTLAESLRSVELFSREVMPAFAASRAAAE